MTLNSDTSDRQVAVLITGAAGAIGQAITLACIRKGWFVFAKEIHQVIPQVNVGRPYNAAGKQFQRDSRPRCKVAPSSIPPVGIDGYQVFFTREEAAAV